MSAGAREPVVGAEVRVEELARSVLTAGDGAWRISGLPPGRYEIVVEHIGYAPARLEIDTEQAADVRIELTPRPVTLSAMVVTASRRLQQLKDAPVAIEVLDRAELRRSGSTDLSEVLVERTGIAIQGGHPVGTGVMLQGLGSERVLVLVDGQPLQGRISGVLDLSRIPVSLVERVEVVKGAQSTLYGSDAMGGVVNIITRQAEHDRWEVGADVLGGSRNRIDLSVNALGSAGAVAWTADGGRRSIELVPGHAGDAATFATRHDGAARVEWRRDPRLSLHAGAMLLEETQRWRSGTLYSFADNLQWTGRAGATITFGSHTLSPLLYATEFRHLSRRSTQSTPVSGSGERESQRLVEGELVYNYAAGMLGVDAGVEARREAIDSDRVNGESRVLHSVEPFMQATLSGGSWSAVPGARVSWSERWGSHFTPRVALLYRPLPRVALRASAGQGFRAPSFKELYMEFLNTGAGAGYRVRGNPQLRPETSRNVSGSIEWAGQRLYARGQMFYNRFDDFIETVEVMEPGGLRLFTYGNIDDGVTYGTELELGATWRAFRAEGGYAWLVAEDRATGETLPGRAAHSGRASLGYAHRSGMRLTLSGVHTGRTLVNRTEEGETFRNAFTRFDARASQTLPRGFELSAGVDNITDSMPGHWPGFAGRQFHVGLGWQVGGERR